MDGVQLSQGYNHYEETVYFLPLNPQDDLVYSFGQSRKEKPEWTMEQPPNGLEPAGFAKWSRMVGGGETI